MILYKRKNPQKKKTNKMKDNKYMTEERLSELRKCFKEGHPVSFEKFITDPYFIGSTPLGKRMSLKWKEIYTGRDLGSGLFDGSEGIFQNPIEHKPTLILTGESATEKTTEGAIVAQLYIMYKFLSLKDPRKTLDLGLISGINNCIVALQKEKADQCIVEPLQAYFNKDFDCPIFREFYDSQDIKIKWFVAKSVGEMLGNDSLCIYLNDVNSFDSVKIDEMVKKAYPIVENRFRRFLGVLPMIILDSTDNKTESYLQTFIKSDFHALPESCKIVDLSR